MGQFMSTLAQRMYELSVPPHRACCLGPSLYRGCLLSWSRRTGCVCCRPSEKRRYLGCVLCSLMYRCAFPERKRLCTQIYPVRARTGFLFPPCERGPETFPCASEDRIPYTYFRFFCAVDSISLMRFNWFTSLAPGS